MVWIAALAGALLGFSAGLFGFKVKSRWCRMHGLVKTCPRCHPRSLVRFP